jgi:leader peptidase (prepilin peptidase)/N-methyltransferase
LYSLIIIAALFGLLWGSFLNVVIYRLPRMQISGIVRRGKPLAFLALPLSYCPHCEEGIKPYHNVPLISFLLLLGRAKCCGAPISIRYPLVEASGALIAAGSLAHFGWNLDALLAGIFLSILLVAAVIDLQRYYLLDTLTLPLLWLGLLVNIDSRFTSLEEAVLGATGGYLLMFGLAAAASFMLKKTAMGGGDFKLMAALGAWLGWETLFVLLFLAALFGLLLAGMRYLARGRAHRIPFGPALALAGAVMLFWGDKMILTYLSYIGG